MKVHQAIKDLYACDSTFGQLSVCPKLTPAHVNPTSFQKMSCPLAFQVKDNGQLGCDVFLKVNGNNGSTKLQVMSDSVGDGMQFYLNKEKADGKPGKFKDCEPIIRLIKLLNAAIDVMNVRIPKKGINNNNWDHHKKVTRGLTSHQFEVRSIL